MPASAPSGSCSPPDCPLEGQRFGGELPAGCDPLLPGLEAGAEADTVLGFSHGRAALGWLMERRGPFAAALVCAYTCPTVPRFLRSHGLVLERFDVGAGASGLEALAAGLPGRVLVLVPALLGFDPWLDAAALARTLGPRALVVIDAAQTAFGQRRHRPPAGGAVLSGPRKCTGAADGAWLALDGVTEAERRAVAALPEAAAATAAKQAARALLAGGDPGREAEALALARQAEQGWPETPCRMSGTSRALLAGLDEAAHAALRLANRARLARALEGVLPPACDDGPGVPFCHAVLTPERPGLLERLHRRRVFATPLWPDAELDPVRHPRAAILSAHLLALPVDQRYREADMDRLASLVLAALREGR
jgi:hypothetical protein